MNAAERRKKTAYRGVEMLHFRAERINQMRPLLNRANARCMTIPQAAKWLGWSVSSIRNWLRILNIKWRKRPVRKVFKHDRTGWEERVAAMLRAGKTHRQIAAELGVGHWNVTRFITERGLTK